MLQFFQSRCCPVFRFSAASGLWAGTGRENNRTDRSNHSGAAERGWTIAELADFAGLARGALYRVVNEDPSATIDTLAKPAAALDVEPARLVTG